MTSKWRYHLDIKLPMRRCVDEEITFDEMIDQIIAELNKCPEFKRSGFADKLKACSTEDELDELLNSIYDFADLHKVWLGI